MAAHLEAMLLQSARLQVAIRRQYAKVKRDPGARYYTYVLQLQDNKFYVGNSDSIYTRLLDHCMMSASSSLWVRQHGPVQRVVEISRDCSREDELYKTLEYMTLFGWQNVRGASYCRPAMRAAPAVLAEFRRSCTRHFDYLTRHEIDEVVSVVRELAEQQAAKSPASSEAASGDGASGSREKRKSPPPMGLDL